MSTYVMLTVRCVDKFPTICTCVWKVKCLLNSATFHTSTGCVFAHMFLEILVKVLRNSSKSEPNYRLTFRLCIFHQWVQKMHGNGQ